MWSCFHALIYFLAYTQWYIHNLRETNMVTRLLEASVTTSRWEIWDPGMSAFCRWSVCGWWDLLTYLWSSMCFLTPVAGGRGLASFGHTAQNHLYCQQSDCLWLAMHLLGHTGWQDLPPVSQIAGVCKICCSCLTNADWFCVPKYHLNNFEQWLNRVNRRASDSRSQTISMEIWPWLTDSKRTGGCHRGFKCLPWEIPTT